MDHRVKGLSSALAICLAAAGSAASAQSSSWRVANYGSEFSTAGIAPQALALDASNDPYAFAFVANGAESAIRLSHYHGANGSIIWQRDVALPEAPWFPFSTFNSGQPTAALAIKEVGKVLDLIKSLKDHGVAVIVISHRMDDIFYCCDRVMALYQGTNFADAPLTETSRNEVIGWIMGTKGHKDSLAHDRVH